MVRLKHITELMTLLRKCLIGRPKFQPPPAIFDFEAIPLAQSSAGPSTSTSDSKKKGRKAGDKKKKSKQNTTADSEENSTMNDEDISQVQATVVSQKDISAKDEMTVDLSTYRHYFRELDFGVFTILQAGLITKAALDSEMNTKGTEILQIGLPELQFLLEDLSLKLSHSLIASANKRRTFFKTKTDKNVGFSSLDHYTPAQIAEKTIKLLPCICDHLEEANIFFQTQISDNDGVEDGPGCFTQESMMMASCYHLLLQCTLSLFSWNGFSSEETRSLLKEALKVIVKRMQASTSQSSYMSLTDALMITFQYFGNLVETVPNLDTAVTLLKLLIVLTEKREINGISEKLAGHAKSFLSRDWRGPDGERLKGAKHNENLQIAIRAFLEYSPDPLEALESLAVTGLAEMINLDKQGCTEQFVSLNRLTFPVFYKAVLNELIAKIKRIAPGKKNESEDVREDRLLAWTMAVKVLQVAVSLTKVFSARSNLMAALKYGRQFVEIFLRQGMPLLDVTFRRHHTEVERLLRSLQQSTRTLHHLCGHSKITKDVSLTNQVPMLKRVLEAFVYRVKAMLSLNNCQNAFWMGNLKNKNLQGKEILTQNSEDNADDSSVADEEEEEEDNDDDQTTAGDDDDDSEVEMEHQEAPTRPEDSNAGGGSYSEVF